MNLVNLDFLVVGFQQRVESWGITEIQYTVTQRFYRHQIYDIEFSYKKNGIYKNTTSRIVYQEAEPTLKELAVQFVLSMGHFDNHPNLYVKLLAGKYKGSVARYTVGHLYLGNDLTGAYVTVPTFVAKNLELLEEADHIPTLVFTGTEFQSKDKFGNINEFNDIIVYVEDGKIHYGVYVENDLLHKRMVLKSIGYQGRVSRTYLKLERDMMNVTKMPSSKAANIIFRAHLTAE